MNVNLCDARGRIIKNIEPFNDPPVPILRTYFLGYKWKARKHPKCRYPRDAVYQAVFAWNVSRYILDHYTRFVADGPGLFDFHTEVLK